MATRDTHVPFDDGPLPAVAAPPAAGDAAVQRQWRTRTGLSSMADAAERFLGEAGFDRAPWLAVAFGAGIAAWFVLAGPPQWLIAIGLAVAGAVIAGARWGGRDTRFHLRRAVIAVCLMAALGVLAIWARSALVGAEPIPGPAVERVVGRVLEREEQPSQGRVRLILAVRDGATGAARKVRVNLPLAADRPDWREGAVVRLRARLLPPAPPMLPGGYDFARAAWFEGLAATGSVLGEPELFVPAPPEGWLDGAQRRLAAHVRSELGGSPGAIAAALASGDRGAISEADEDAMRDAGLTHLLSISGLHVSALIAAVYFVAIRLLALWPWLALRLRLPLVAAALAALAGIGYTLLTGAEVPTVRSCVGAMLVLVALALGREPLSLRMLAVAALFVLALWPESLVGPSFQMSFAAVLAIVALHGAGPVRSFLAPREEGWLRRGARNLAMLLFTGFVIELALMPIVLFHFHRAGVYGAFANVVAIPLTTFVSMPLIALALVLDTIGLGAPAWWLAGKSLELLLAIAHFTAAQPSAVKLAPAMGGVTFALFLAGGLWLALWRGRVRLAGFMPIALAATLALGARAPDLLISGDGRHIGVVGEGDRLLVLREGRSTFARDNLLELAGMRGEPVVLDQWPGARCNPDFCFVTLDRGGRNWQVLIGRSRARLDELQLAAACERADIVISDRWLPRSCRPRWLKADRRMLGQSGGLAIDLARPGYTTVAASQGAHGWWRPRS